MGDVRLARAAECLEGREGVAAAVILSDTPLAARRIVVVAVFVLLVAFSCVVGSEPLVR